MTELPTTLELIEVTKHFGGVNAVDDVNVGFDAGQVTCVIGPNGAGKTTLFNLINGALRPDKGEILFNRKSLQGQPIHRIARTGVGRLFQDVRVFDKMTVLENVCAARQKNPGENLGFACFPPIYGSFERENLRRSREFLSFVGLLNHADKSADQLSYGQQKLLAIARLLNNDATCLLLDEPASGVNPDMVSELLKVIRNLADQKHTVVIIEHDLAVVREIGDWVYLMEEGRIEAFGTPQEMLRDASLTRFIPVE